MHVHALTTLRHMPLPRYIKTDAHKMEVGVKPPMAVTNAVSWRVEGIKHKKNEVGGGSRGLVAGGASMAIINGVVGRHGKGHKHKKGQGWGGCGWAVPLPFSEACASSTPFASTHAPMRWP